MTSTTGSICHVSVPSTRARPPQCHRGQQHIVNSGHSDSRMVAARSDVDTKSALSSGSHVLACSTAIVAILLLCLSSGANAADSSRLRVPDMSSPRATLQGFLHTTDDLYTGWASLLTSYLNSGVLYPTAAQRKAQEELFRHIPNAVHALDLSEIPPVEAGIAGAKRMLQLRAILDRIDLPPMEDVPDAAAMASQASKRWRLPNTEIDFVLVQQGPRTGDYLVSPKTVERLPEFYERVEDLPTRAGPTRLLLDAFHQFRPNSGQTIYGILSGLPLGLSHIIPLRWALNWPDWTMIPVGGVAIWQWIGVSIDRRYCRAGDSSPRAASPRGYQERTAARLLSAGARCRCRSPSY